MASTAYVLGGLFLFLFSFIVAFYLNHNLNISANHLLFTTTRTSQRITAFVFGWRYRGLLSFTNVGTDRTPLVIPDYNGEDGAHFRLRDYLYLLRNQVIMDTFFDSWDSDYVDSGWSNLASMSFRLEKSSLFRMLRPYTFGFNYHTLSRPRPERFTFAFSELVFDFSVEERAEDTEAVQYSHNMYLRRYLRSVAPLTPKDDAVLERVLLLAAQLNIVGKVLIPAKVYRDAEAESDEDDVDAGSTESLPALSPPMESGDLPRSQLDADRIESGMSDEDVNGWQSAMKDQVISPGRFFEFLGILPIYIALISAKDTRVHNLTLMAVVVICVRMLFSATLMIMQAKRMGVPKIFSVFDIVLMLVHRIADVYLATVITQAYGGPPQLDYVIAPLDYNRTFPTPAEIRTRPNITELRKCYRRCRGVV